MSTIVECKWGRLNTFRATPSVLGILAICQLIFFAGDCSNAQINNTHKQRGKADTVKTLTIAGTCLSMEERTPIRDVELTLFEVTGAREQIREIRRTISDQEGRYSFSDLAPTNQSRVSPRSYLVKAVAEGHPDVLFDFRQNFDMAGFATELRMHEGTGSIKGKVTDETGNPLAGASIQRAYIAPANEVGLKTAKTNKEGLFILGGMPMIDDKPRSVRGAYIQVYHPDYPMTQFSQKSLDYSTFVMTRGCIVQGSVVDSASKKPLAGVSLCAVTADTDYEGREDKTTTDDNGRFRLVLVEGNYNLILEDAKYVAKFNYLDCRHGGSKELEPIQATVGGWIVGQVINTDTQELVVMTDVGDDQSERVGVGLFGPDRPIGKLIHTHWLDEVDDEGCFRILAHPGDNFPYLCNLRGNRNTWETMKQPPVVVDAGKETRYDLTFEPPRTPEQKMAKAKIVLDKLPTELDARCAGILAEFRKLNHTVDECETWCLLMQDLVHIGKPAVPALCRELETTDSSTMIRRLAFALRAIGDPQAVPALIRAIPKTLQPSMSDYGLLVADPELTTFMQTHDLDEKGRATYFDFGRPMREVYGSLNRLTKRHQEVTPLASISRSPDQRALARQEKIFHDIAREWAAWWENNWQQFDVDQAYGQVNLPDLKPRDTSGYPVGLDLTPNATMGSGLTGQVLTPVGDADAGATFLMDLDTGQNTHWPKELSANDDSPECVAATRNFADKRGFDLMCVAEINENGVADYMLVGFGLELWEIKLDDAKKIEEFVKTGKLPEGRQLDTQSLVHRDSKSKIDTSALGSSFLYVTKDQGLGVITLSDFVETARDITGLAGAPRGVGFHRGVKFNYRQIAR